jgi:uncharacterized membrane-anchored protein YhcB (DUF1043 family)
MTFEYFLAYGLPFLSGAIGAVAGVTFAYAKLRFGIIQIRRDMKIHLEFHKKDSELYYTRQLNRDKEILALWDRMKSVEGKSDVHMPFATCEAYRNSCQNDIQKSLTKIESAMQQSQKSITDKFERFANFMGAVEQFIRYHNGADKSAKRTVVNGG